MRNNTCLFCRFSDCADDDRYTCRRRAPTPVFDLGRPRAERPDGPQWSPNLPAELRSAALDADMEWRGRLYGWRSEAGWPIVGSDDWCGEFEPDEDAR